MQASGLHEGIGCQRQCCKTKNTRPRRYNRQSRVFVCVLSLEAPIAATVAAASAAATTASITATVAAAATTAKSTTSAATILRWLGFIDFDLASAKCLTIAGRNRLTGVGCALHLHEGEAARLASHAIGWDGHCLDSSGFAEQILEFLLGCAIRQISHVQFRIHL